MQKNYREIDLQFFAGEGASSGEGAGAPAGVGDGNAAAADAGQRDTLESMGVPAAEIRKYRAQKGKQEQQAVRPEATIPTQDAAATEPEQQQEQAPAKRSLKDALKDNPEWNREMQSWMQERVKKTNSHLEKALQIAELVGRDYGIEADDLANLDLDALWEKLEGDRGRYEAAAMEHGTDVDTEMRLEKLQRENKAQKKVLEEQQRETELRNHYALLQQQAAELKKQFPDFNLDRELENREFYERTLPGSKDTVESAFYAIHGREIAQRQAQAAAGAAARGVSQAMANSIQAGRRMPAENGTVARAPGNIQSKRYSEMSPAERKAWERQAMAGKRFD